VHQSLIVIDDFYPDPEAVREAALGYAYPEGSGPRTFPGRNSRQKHLPQAMDQAVSQVIGARVAGDPNPETTHGKFRITLASEKSRYLVHADPTLLDWVGVIYLNLPEQVRGGTAFFRHKGLNSDRTPMSQEDLAAYGPASVGELLSQDGNDPDKWLHLMTVPMRFNRLILYRPWSWHSAGAAFGTSLEDGRLIQLVAFQTQPGAPGAA